MQISLSSSQRKSDPENWNAAQQDSNTPYEEHLLATLQTVIQCSEHILWNASFPVAEGKYLVHQ